MSFFTTLRMEAMRKSVYEGGLQRGAMSTDMNERAQNAINEINGLIRELEGLISMDANLAWKRMERWKERAGRNLAQNVNEDEAKRFLEEELSHNNIDAYVTIENNIQSQRALLQSLVEELTNHPNDFFGDTAPNPIPGALLDSTYETAFRLMHQTVVLNAKQKFQDGHYADAVESAMKAVNSRVKNFYKSKTGEEKDGVDLMRKAMTPTAPVITLGDLSTESGKNKQQGFMEIFSGSISAIRNPKAHANVQITAKRAIECLFLASLEMSVLDEAGVPT